MRKAPVLTLVGLAVLAAVPVHSATLVASEAPDFVLSPGATVSFDLADFFDSPSAITYSADGGTVTGSMVEVFGAAAPGKKTAKFTASSGGESVTLESVVQVSAFSIGDIAVDNNNRIAGVNGGNNFFNAVAPGATVNSVQNLTIPAGGTGTSPGGSSAPALVATVASVEMTANDRGFRSVTRTLATNSGLTPKLNANGSYSIAASANFKGAWLVTLGAKLGASADAVHLVAAQAANVGLTATSVSSFPAGTNPAATVSFANNAATFNAAAGQGSLVFSNTDVAVPAGKAVTVRFDYNTNSTGVYIAAVGFDGGILNGAQAQYINVSAPNIEAGKTKALAASFVSYTGTVTPGFQVFNAGSTAATVTISNVQVVMAGPVVDYALDANAKLALPATFDTFTPAAKPTMANGVMTITGTGGFSNAYWTLNNVGVGTNVAECYVRRVGAAEAGAAFALDLTPGGSESLTYVRASEIPEGTWTKVISAYTSSVAAPHFLVIQSAGMKVEVTNVAVRVVNSKAQYFDAALLGS